MSQKLIKVARELNVGLHSIVETLHSKGFTSLEEKPTAEITDEMMSVLQKEYQRDLAIKQEADKLSRPMYNKPAAPVAHPAPPPQVSRPVAFLPPREEAEMPDAPKAEPLPVAPPQQEQTPALTRERPQQLRILGRIELPVKPGPKPKVEEKPERMREERPAPAETSIPIEKPTAAETPIPVEKPTATEKPTVAGKSTPAPTPTDSESVSGTSQPPAPARREDRPHRQLNAS